MGVEFDEESGAGGFQSYNQEAQMGWIMKSLIKIGIVQTSSQASVLLIMVAVGALTLSIFILIKYVI